MSSSIPSIFSISTLNLVKAPLDNGSIVYDKMIYTVESKYDRIYDASIVIDSNNNIHVAWHTVYGKWCKQTINYAKFSPDGGVLVKPMIIAEMEEPHSSLPLTSPFFFFIVPSVLLLLFFMDNRRKFFK